MSFPDSRDTSRVSQEVLSLHLYGFGARQVQSCVCSPLSLVTSGPSVSPRGVAPEHWLLSVSLVPLSFVEMAQHSVNKERNHLLIAAQTLDPTTLPHTSAFPPPLSAMLGVPGVSGSCSFHARFSLLNLDPKGRGTSAPCQRFMGHLRLLAVCPKAPQSLHFTCAWRKPSQ